ncbi:pollen-specific leucine-rich repeat extensin-like protein 3, partial [Momordica charantia]|uniref:Cell wall hydroxyproline-rich glycoprotein n=1 Tax=Momordica charantia TaxID=3673 RepID=A0A6J1CE38_MOMCH
MKGPGCCLFISLLLLSSFLLFSSALSDAKVYSITHRQLLTLHENGDLLDDYESTIQVNETFSSPRLRRAYIALQAWKMAIYSDPLNTTASWIGADVCSYTGVFCAPALDDPKLEVVAGIDLNHADIAGYLPVELGLLTDIALFHINSNRFCGIIPTSFWRLTLLYEFDISNNRFVGHFPEVVVRIPNLKYLDLRFNDFEGELPSSLFTKELDAIFLNNNRFTSNIPENFGDSPASVIVIANNNFTGCIPSSIGKMGNTLKEFVMLNNGLAGCIPGEIGLLGNATVVDVSYNKLSGILPKSFDGLKGVEALDISGNSLTGFVAEGVCNLPKLVNFTFSNNFFNGEAESCVPQNRKNIVLDDSSNCLPERPNQKTTQICTPVIHKTVDCSKAKCGGGLSPPSPSTSTSMPPKPDQPQPPKQEIPEIEAPTSSIVPEPKSPPSTPVDDSHDQSPIPRYRPPPP